MYRYSDGDVVHNIYINVFVTPIESTRTQEGMSVSHVRVLYYEYY